MKKLLENNLPESDKKLKWTSVGITVIISGLLTEFGVYGAGKYGIALFMLIPTLIGVCSTILYGLKKDINRKEAVYIGFLSLGVFTACLLLFAYEGIICIAMAAPMALLLTLIGSLIGYPIIKKMPNDAPTTILILIGAIPIMSFIEKDYEPALNSVVTTIEIKAHQETVWENVVEFPQLDKPTEFIFKTGIAYPINAKIEGKGVGAIRHCNFTTGSFIEPITVWEKPKLLKFDVAQQPDPMKELSFWDIKSAHLHDYFISRQGQFKLTALPNGNTLLEGTTWYYNNIRPAYYWRQWSDFIIHKIHERVLTHIKKNAENDKNGKKHKTVL